MVVFDVPGRSLTPGQLAPQGQGVECGLCTREFNGLWTMNPVSRAHLRCAFLIMSGGHHVNAFSLTPTIRYLASTGYRAGTLVGGCQCTSGLRLTP